MNLPTITEDRESARSMWREYKDALKDHPEDDFLKTMKKVYNQLKGGRKLIDINRVMERGGLNERFEPRLAICRAGVDQVLCHYDRTGVVTFIADDGRRWQWSPRPYDATVRDVFTELPSEHWEGERFSQYKRLQTPLPKVPPRAYPQGKITNYHILWEVEKWEKYQSKRKTAPRDPWLLKQVEANIFVVLAGWKLTDLEIAVIEGQAR